METVYFAILKDEKGYPKLLVGGDMEGRPEWWSNKEEFLLKKKLNATILPWEL